MPCRKRERTEASSSEVETGPKCHSGDMGQMTNQNHEQGESSINEGSPPPPIFLLVCLGMFCLYCTPDFNFF
jgi:hypothetical protein